MVGIMLWFHECLDEANEEIAALKADIQDRDEEVKEQEEQLYALLQRALASDDPNSSFRAAVELYARTGKSDLIVTSLKKRWASQDFLADFLVAAPDFDGAAPELDAHVRAVRAEVVEWARKQSEDEFSITLIGALVAAAALLEDADEAKTIREENANQVGRSARSRTAGYQDPNRGGPLPHGMR